MKLNVYSIYDTASGAYSRPFFLQADGEARRAFTDLATNAESDIGKHPEDYHLTRCATFDDQTAEFHPERPEQLMSGLEAVAQSRNVNPADLQYLDSAISNGEKPQ